MTHFFSKNELYQIEMAVQCTANTQIRSFLSQPPTHPHSVNYYHQNIINTERLSLWISQIVLLFVDQTGGRLPS